MDYAETPTGSTPMPPLPPSGAVEAHTNFFKPLTDSSPLASNETKLPFPGFGFWPKSYAEILYDFTLKYGYVEFFNDRRSICDIVTNVDLNLGLSDVFADSNEPKCPPMWDDLSCFPATVAGQISVIPCPEEIKGVPYDTSHNATRGCTPNGEWASKANYDNCNPIIIMAEPEGSNCDNSTYMCHDYTINIYSIGYTLSLVTLIIALTIFISFREVKCLRNKIHGNLFLTYVLSLSCWIVTALIQHFPSSSAVTAICVTTVGVRFFHLTTFFWMFVEGFYLFLQVKAPLHVEVVKLRHYICIGWGLPLMLFAFWSGLTYHDHMTGNANGNAGTSGLDGNSTSSPFVLVNETSSPDPGTDNGTAPGSSVTSCPFLEDAGGHSDWAYKIPVLLILACNMVFLIWIMAVVISKLRSEHTTERHQQHYRAAKALLVIFPLLGISYIITLVGPAEGTLGHFIFRHVRAVCLSLQGFVITLPYCFLNTEVRGILKQNWDRWRLTRSSDPFAGANRRASGRNSFSMANYYSTATTDTRFSPHPQGLPMTPERIPLQTTSYYNNSSAAVGGNNSRNNSFGNSHLRPPGSGGMMRNGSGSNGNNNGNNATRMSPNSSNSSEKSNGGSPRKIFVTIHENENEVTTRLVVTPTSASNNSNSSPNHHHNFTMNNMAAMERPTIITTET